MSSKQRRIRAAAVPPGADDLQIIDGIGPGIESRLYSANILTYTQLANLMPDAIAPLVAGIAGMSVDRIIKEDWIGQASRLAPESSPTVQQSDTLPALPRVQEEPPTPHHPYATFTVELLLDEDNNVRRTRANHIQGGAEDSWTGWHAARLTDFFVQQGELRLPVEEQDAIVAESAAAPAEVGFASEASSAIEPVPVAAPAEAMRAAAAARERIPALPPKAAGTVYVRDLALSPGGTSTPTHMLRSGQPFSVDLTLAIADATIPPELPLTYTATLFAKKMGGKERSTVGETTGSMSTKDCAPINIVCTALPQGIYRMEAAVVVSLSDSANLATTRLSSFLEGGLIQVF